MPVHDWTRVSAGEFQDFHLGWIAELKRVLNATVLPDGYYALAEQHSVKAIPDVLALARRGSADVADDERGDVPAVTNGGGGGGGGGVAVADAPPRLSIRASSDDARYYARRRRTLAIRHVSGDRLIALIEIASPGNKDRQSSVEKFTYKLARRLREGCHAVVVDAFPPGPHDLRGLGAASFQAMGGKPFVLPAEKSRSVAAFCAAESGNVDCYAEPLAVGDAWPDVPLFLDADHYVNVPLEPTYAAALTGVPRHLLAAVGAA